MTIRYIAAIIESAYNNGAVQSSDRKMDIDDFHQMARAANGDVMRSMWYEEMQVGNPILYFSGALTTERFEIKKNGRYRVVTLGEGGAVKLPYAMGIISVMPVMDDKDEDCEDFDNEDFYAKGEPGMEHTFGSDALMDDLGEAFYVPIGNTLRLFGFKEAKLIEADYLKNDEDLDVPEGPAWRIINLVLGPVLKVVGYPVDVTDDNNPNVVTIKKALADPQGL